MSMARRLGGGSLGLLSFSRGRGKEEGRRKKGEEEGEGETRLPFK